MVCPLNCNEFIKNRLQASYKWNVSERRVHQYCQAGRIPGITRFGRSWVIPADAKKPTDPRSIKTQSGADNEANH